MVATLPLHRTAWDGGGASDSAPLSPELVAAFEEEGVILVRSPLTESELDDAEAAWHELTDVEGADKASNPGFIRLISHPFFERVAQQLLRAEDVRLAELGPRHRPPTPEQPQGDAAAQAERWAAGAHLDIQITTSDFQATPRRDLLAIWFWISDVTPERAAMRVLPRSHVPIMEHHERVLTPEQKRQLPRQHGLYPQPPVSYPSYPEYVPMPPDFRYTECEPMPVAVPRGTAQIFTQSLLHSQWVNSDTEPRKAFVVSWLPRAVPIGWDSHSQLDALRDQFPRLKNHMSKIRPGREHIIPTEAELNHFVSTYEKLWPETFLPGADGPSAESVEAARRRAAPKL